MTKFNVDKCDSALSALKALNWLSVLAGHTLSVYLSLALSLAAPDPTPWMDPGPGSLPHPVC